MAERRFPLNGSFLTREDDRAMMSDPSLWPGRPILAVKNRGQVGRLVEGEGPVVHVLDVVSLAEATKEEFSDWGSLLDAGWMVD